MLFFLGISTERGHMKKILLIDDEKEIHSIIKEYFPKDQYRLISAYDGLEGLMKCKNEEFDFVLLDFKMPKMDGPRFYQQFRDLQALKKVESTPIIFISGFIDDLKHRKITWNKCEFLLKPFQKEDLIQKIEKFEKKTQPKSCRIVLQPGDVLFNEDEELAHLFYVTSGMLQLSRQESIIGSVGTGDLLGETIIAQGKTCYSVKAIEKSELLPIPKEKILEVVQGQPKWIKLLIEDLGKKLKDTIKQIA